MPLARLFRMIGAGFRRMARVFRKIARVFAGWRGFSQDGAGPAGWRGFSQDGAGLSQDSAGFLLYRDAEGTHR